MEALRIVLTQTSANYKKEETVLNKMTYPLPPFSTIIGALHNACNYTSYHPMDISIQGRYESMHKKAYTDYCFLNSVNDDRGILVKMKNKDFLSTAFDKVAVAKKSQGNSFRNRITIEVINKDLLQEYRYLKDLSDEITNFKKERINPLMDLIKKRKGTLANKKKLFKDDKTRSKVINKRDKEIKGLEKDIKQRLKEYEDENYKIPYSKFSTLTTSLKYYEILNNIELILHIKSNRNTLIDIKNNIYNLESIGRSEDFVEVKDVCFVNLKDETREELISKYSAYLDYELIEDETLLLQTTGGTAANGTKYYLNKNYTIENNKRIFEKKKVIYASQYSADRGANNLFFDLSGEDKYIVNFN